MEIKDYSCEFSKLCRSSNLDLGYDIKQDKRTLFEIIKLIKAVEKIDHQKRIYLVQSYLLKSIIDRNSPSFVTACMKGNKQLIQLFIDAAEKENICQNMFKSCDYNAFHHLCINQHIELIHLFIDKAKKMGCLKEMLESRNYSAFISDSNRLNVLEILLDTAEKCDIDLYYSILTYENYSIFRAAFCHDFEDRKKLLMDAWLHYGYKHYYD